MKLQFAAAVIAATFAAGAFAAPVQYTSSAVQINRTAKTDYLGKVAVASPVTVLQKQGNKVKVRVDGWTLVEYPTQIFSEPGVRIEYASFDENNVVKITPKAGEKTVQGNKWVKASAEGWIDAKALTSDINGLWKQGCERQQQACSSCHAAPAANHFTANQWASTLPERGGRVGHTRAGANALMFKYLQAHAKK